MRIVYPLLRGRDFKILIATGSHRAPTREEYDFIFGALYGEIKDRVHVHDAKKSPCYSLGKTRHGNDLRLNTLVRDADAIIPIGSIEPHYFAGYTGGRKCLMPGVASYDCITANHKLAISPAAQAMVLKGNPVAEEFDDAEQILEKLNVFAIMTVLDGEHRVYAAAAGDLKESFYSLLPRADEVFVVPIKRKADIVVTLALRPCLAVYASRLCGVTLRAYWQRAYSRPLLIGLLLSVACWLLTVALPSSSLAGLAASAVLAGVAWAALVWAVGLSAGERRLVSARLFKHLRVAG